MNFDSETVADKLKIIRLGKQNKIPFTHDGEEFVYLLSGKLECRLGDDTFVLRPGDSLYFDPSRKHSSRVFGKKPARYLCIFIQRRKTARQ